MGLWLSKNNYFFFLKNSCIIKLVNIMKKILSFILIFIIFIGKVDALNLDISSKNAILYNMDSGEVIYEKNSDEKVSIASLTKIMTALITLENVENLDERVIIIEKDFEGLIEANAVTAGFTKGEVVTYKDLLYGLLLPSGADAAKALARLVAGSEEKFIEKMNDKVKKMNLKQTNFSTVIGLDDVNNYSTARELSLIFKEALKSKNFKNILTTKEYTTSDGKLKFKSTIQSNAKKYNIDVPYILGGKTGTTTDAGLCLATIAKANNVNYMLVTLGALYDKKAPHNIEDAKVIYDYFIENYGNQKIVDKQKSFKKIKVKYSDQESLNLYPTKSITKYLENDYDKKNVKLVYDGKEEITPFDKKGSKIGTLKIYYQDKLIDTQNIILNENLHFNTFNFIKEYILIVASILIVIIFVIVLKKHK